MDRSTPVGSGGRGPGVSGVVCPMEGRVGRSRVGGRRASKDPFHPETGGWGKGFEDTCPVRKGPETIGMGFRELPSESVSGTSPGEGPKEGGVSVSGRRP